MKIYVIVGENTTFSNISARAAFSKRGDAESWVANPGKNYFDDRTVIIELELDGEIDNG